MFNNFLQQSCHLWDNMEKDGEARQVTGDYNMAHVLCMLDN